MAGSVFDGEGASVTYRVWVRVFDQHGKTLDDTLIEVEDYGQAMVSLADWAKSSFMEKDL